MIKNICLGNHQTSSNPPGPGGKPQLRERSMFQLEKRKVQMDSPEEPRGHLQHGSPLHTQGPLPPVLCHGLILQIYIYRWVSSQAPCSKLVAWLSSFFTLFIFFPKSHKNVRWFFFLLPAQGTLQMLNLPPLFGAAQALRPGVQTERNITHT